MDTLPISDLLVTQDGLRDYEQFKRMVNFVRTGGLFNDETLGSYAIRHNLSKVAPRIEIARFEDNIMAVHNGHHRIMSIYFGRRSKELHPSEFFIREWRYRDYKDIVLPYWVTPFDVMDELRVHELHDWKDEVRRYRDVHGDSATEKFILQNKSRYAYKRGRIYTVGDLSEVIKTRVYM